MDDIEVTNLRQLDPTLTGTGVRVAQPEATSVINRVDQNDFQVDPNDPSINQPQRLFTYINSIGFSSTTYSVSKKSTHAIGVGANFYGTPGGVAPGVSHVDNYNATYFYNTLVVNQTSIAAKVVNQSFVFGGQQAAIDQAYDNYAGTYNTVFCSGVGNNDSRTYPNLNSPATCYNGIGVAAWGTAGDGSSYGPTTDGRSKPDITAPADKTSYSTPLVSGAAAVLVEAGKRLSAPAASYAIDSRTVKALLLNGAVKKPELQTGTGTSRPGWTHSATAPLDRYQGTGVLNVLNSYNQLISGLCASGTTTASQTPPSVTGTFSTMSGWDYATLTSGTTSGNNKVNHYFFDLNAAQGSSFTVTSTLVWNRQYGQSSINNLDLYLYNASGTLIASSISTVDNVEHLFASYLAPGRYDLEVVKNGLNSVSASETYALVFNFTANTPLTASISPSGSNAVIQFPSIAGHTYRVERSPDLSANSWTTFSDNIAGTGSSIQVVDTDALNLPQQFYRVKLLQ